MSNSVFRAIGIALSAIFAGATLAAKPTMPMLTTSFEACHRQGCTEHTTVRLAAEEVQSIFKAFGPPAAIAKQERAAIARAISRFEQIVGPRTGTDRDLGGTFPGAFRAGQMDCIDESTNTTTYLHLLDQAGMLRWHDIQNPSTRFPIPRGWWPHTTAVILERATGTKYVVDSWFDDNGYPPHIVELSIWKRGWKPAPVSAAK